jgi:hypothetical protein
MMPDPLTSVVTTTSDSVPPPGDVLKLVEHTARTVVTKVTTTPGGTKTPTSSPNRDPSAARPGLGLVRHASHGVRATANTALGSWSLPAGAQLSDLLPSLPSGLAGPAARPPVVAGTAGTAPTVSRVQNAAQTDDVIGRRSSVVRAILVALSAAAAATLTAAHVTVARGSRR